jgi:hypothetical protein
MALLPLSRENGRARFEMALPPAKAPVAMKGFATCFPARIGELACL